MIGAIVGDIVGSRFEWHNRKSKRFTFMKGRVESSRSCHFTDDTVMTLAVAAAIMRWKGCVGAPFDALSAEAIMSMQEFGHRYPRAGYGGAFRRWLRDEAPQPYNSWGNGAAMRVSACGWAGRTLDEIRPTYAFDVSCQGSVPQALEAFFESTSFEDAIRNAISIGGDSDTIGAICGAVAGAYYGVPAEIRAKAETFLDVRLLETLHAFEREFCVAI